MARWEQLEEKVQAAEEINKKDGKIQDNGRQRQPTPSEKAAPKEAVGSADARTMPKTVLRGRGKAAPKGKGKGRQAREAREAGNRDPRGDVLIAAARIMRRTAPRVRAKLAKEFRRMQ